MFLQSDTLQFLCVSATSLFINILYSSENCYILLAIWTRNKQINNKWTKLDCFQAFLWNIKWQKTKLHVFSIVGSKSLKFNNSINQLSGIKPSGINCLKYAWSEKRSIQKKNYSLVIQNTKSWIKITKAKNEELKK